MITDTEVEISTEECCEEEEEEMVSPAEEPEPEPDHEHIRKRKGRAADSPESEHLIKSTFRSRVSPFVH